MLKELFLAFLSCSLLSIITCENAKEAELTNSLNCFAVNTFKQFASSPGNVVTCPFALACQLIPLLTEAEGETAREISEALCLKNFTMANLKDFAPKKFNALNTDKEDSTVIGASVLATDEHAYIKPSCTDNLERHFKMPLMKVDFTKKSRNATGKINQSILDNTNQTMKHFLQNDLPDNTVLAVLSGFVAKLCWKESWTSSTTMDFMNYDMKDYAKKVPFMYKKTQMMYYQDPVMKCHVMEISLCKDLKSVILFVPFPDANIETMLSNFNCESLKEAHRSLRTATVNVTMPKIKTASLIDYVPIMKSMNITQLFTDQASLPGMGPSMRLSAANQKAALIFNEEGCAPPPTGESPLLKTKIGYGHADKPIDVLVNRPFMMVILDKNTGIMPSIVKITSV